MQRNEPRILPAVILPLSNRKITIYYRLFQAPTAPQPYFIKVNQIPYILRNRANYIIQPGWLLKIPYERSWPEAIHLVNLGHRPGKRKPLVWVVPEGVYF